MSGPGDLCFSAAVLDAEPGGMLAVYGCRSQSPAGASSFLSGPWRPSSAMSGPGELRLFAAALDVAPSTWVQRPCLALETERLCLALETPARLLLHSMHARGHADSFPRKMPLLGCRGWSPAGTTSFLCAFCLALQAALISVCPRRPPLLCCCARCCARGHAGSLPRRNFFLRAEPRARQGRTHSCLALKAEIRTVCVLIFARRARCHN